MAEVRGWVGRLEQPFCYERITQSGNVALSDSVAMLSAEKAWSEFARSKYGEVFMSLENARGKRSRCYQAGTNESVIGGIADRAANAIGADRTTQRRCEIEARPCMVPFTEMQEDGK